MLIRVETPEDPFAVHAVNAAAFKTRAEADLVDTLRREASPIISLVAEDAGEIIGHILFSPVQLAGFPHLIIMGLGPMAVAPAHQRQGIGSLLVKAGLDKCRKIGAGAVIVLGHPHFYPRFGFEPSVKYGIRSEYDVPEDVFMLVELQPGYLTGATGMITYHPAFNSL